MKNITLSAEEELIERARFVAKTQNTTLNAAFREWLQQFTSTVGRAERYKALMNDLRHIDSGGHFTRDELNER